MSFAFIFQLFLTRARLKGKVDLGQLVCCAPCPHLFKWAALNRAIAFKYAKCEHTLNYVSSYVKKICCTTWVNVISHKVFKQQPLVSTSKYVTVYSRSGNCLTIHSYNYDSISCSVSRYCNWINLNCDKRAKDAISNIDKLNRLVTEHTHRQKATSRRHRTKTEQQR